MPRIRIRRKKPPRLVKKKLFLKKPTSNYIKSRRRIKNKIKEQKVPRIYRRKNGTRKRMSAWNLCKSGGYKKR